MSTHPASWSEAQVAAYTFRAEIRAIEEGHRAWTTGTGYPAPTFSVVAHDADGVRYDLTAYVKPGHVLRVSCTCPSGLHRAALPIPCKHAALVARRIEREGAAEWRDGLWHGAGVRTCPECDGPDGDHLATCTHAPPADPFEDLT